MEVRRSRPASPGGSTRRTSASGSVASSSTGTASGRGRTSGDDDDDEDEGAGDGEFKPCGVCGEIGRLRPVLGAGPPDEGRPAVPGADHPPARGPAARPAARHRLRAAARPEGAGLLRLPPGRRAARAQPADLRDARRDPPPDPAGLDRTRRPAVVGDNLSLERLFLAVMVGAKRLSRAPAPRTQAHRVAAGPRRGQQRDRRRRARRQPDRPATGLLMLTRRPPQSLLRAIYATHHRQVLRPGLPWPGLAARTGNTAQPSCSPPCPPIDGVASSDEEKLALVRLWLAQWAARARGIWFPSHADGELVEHQGRREAAVREVQADHPVAPARRRQEDVRPAVAARPAHHVLRAPGKHYRLRGGTVALETGGPWGYCERCRTPSGPSPGSTGASTAAPARSAPWTRPPTRCSGRARATTAPARSAPWPTRPSRP